MRKVEENMSFDSLHLICGDPGAVDYFDLPEVERERYDQFISQLCPGRAHLPCQPVARAQLHHGRSYLL
jgi:hypothetical protein